MLQKQMLQRANELGVPSITATQMLESMIGSPWPTRAETSDVANAILDGTDAVMLSAETAVGAYPVESVRVMDRIALEVEGLDAWVDAGAPSPPNLAHSLAHAATVLAAEIHATAMVAFTRSGLTARFLSKERPGIPIYAFTTAPGADQRLALWHGVTPLLGRLTRDTGARISYMVEELRRRELVAGGERVVVVRVTRSQATRFANFVTVRTVPR